MNGKEFEMQAQELADFVDNTGSQSEVAERLRSEFLADPENYAEILRKVSRMEKVCKGVDITRWVNLEKQQESVTVEDLEFSFEDIFDTSPLILDTGIRLHFPWGSESPSLDPSPSQQKGDRTGQVQEIASYDKVERDEQPAADQANPSVGKANLKSAAWDYSQADGSLAGSPYYQAVHAAYSESFLAHKIGEADLDYLLVCNDEELGAYEKQFRESLAGLDKYNRGSLLAEFGSIKEDRDFLKGPLSPSEILDPADYAALMDYLGAAEVESIWFAPKPERDKRLQAIRSEIANQNLSEAPELDDALSKLYGKQVLLGSAEGRARLLQGGDNETAPPPESFIR